MPSTAIEPTVRLDAHGVYRVGNSRVPLDTVVACYREGCSAEEIVMRFDSLELADIHDAISYYLRHQAEVEAYLEQRYAQAQTVKEEIEARQGVKAIRAMLVARRAAKETVDAVPS